MSERSRQRDQKRKQSFLAGRFYDDTVNRTDRQGRLSGIGLKAIMRGRGVPEPTIELFVGGMPRRDRRVPKIHVANQGQFRATRQADKDAVDALDSANTKPISGR